MDAIVTARVPKEIKNQVADILSDIGASPTQLINAAYAYVLRERKLPFPDIEHEKTGTVRREPTPEEAREFAALIGAFPLPTPKGGWDTRDYREILSEGKHAEYEALT